MSATTWTAKYAALDFFLFLVKIGLTKQGIGQAAVSNFVRRYKHLFIQPNYPSDD